MNREKGNSTVAMLPGFSSPRKKTFFKYKRNSERFALSKMSCDDEGAPWSRGSARRAPRRPGFQSCLLFFAKTFSNHLTCESNARNRGQRSEKTRSRKMARLKQRPKWNWRDKSKNNVNHLLSKHDVN